MKKLLVANWKMNPTSESAAIRLAKASDFKGVVITPPFLFLEAVSHVVKKAMLGAQDLAWENPKRGAYTGEVSAKMLKDANVRYVIIGHSERRKFLKETDVMINKKVKIALREGFRVILCVGEPKSVRRKGITAAKKFVGNRLKKDLKDLTKNPGQAGQKPWPGRLTTKNLFIAYEPIWAIGGKGSDTPKDAKEMAKFIKELLVKSKKLKVGVLYGGSVNSKNAKSFLKLKEVNGALVGGASLKKEFGKIIKAV